MNPDMVFRKTAKGREELEKRTARLDHKRRTVLILVDGRADVAALGEKIAHLANGTELLQSLWTEGFVEPVAGSAAPAAAAPSASASQRPLTELKTTAARAIERLMGPDGDSLALKVERAATHDEFFAEAAKAREALRAFLGPRQAEEFWKSLA
jgi:hypothetical protein